MRGFSIKALTGECYDKRNTDQPSGAGAACGHRNCGFGSCRPACDADRVVRNGCADRKPRVIARMWHGSVPASRSEEYLTRMRQIALPDYKTVSGNRGAF